MARFDRLSTYNQLLESGLVPLFYHPDSQTCQKITNAVVEGGGRILEFTNRGDRAVDAFKDLMSYRENHHPKLILGVGSVLDAPTAALYIAMGADFIVAPLFDAAVAVLCNKRKIPYIPGCGTVNEISKAEEAGAEIIKIFPGGVGGPGFIKAVKGPMPWTRLMPTGGVDSTQESVDSWISAGACALGMGSKLITKESVTKSDFGSISTKVEQCLGWIKKAREK